MRPTAEPASVAHMAHTVAGYFPVIQLEFLSHGTYGIHRKGLQACHSQYSVP